MRIKLQFSHFILNSLCLLIISGCEKIFPPDYRDKYLGDWSFEVTTSQSQILSYESTTSYYEGKISLGSGQKNLLITYSGELNVSVDRDGNIGDLPGDYNYGKV